MPLNVRPRRSATLRTRLDREAVLAVLRGIAEEAAPQGLRGMTADGYFIGGWVGEREFDLDYHLNSAKNPQTYAVHGKVEDGRDWRVLRLWLRARSPWLGWWGLAGLALFGVWAVVAEEIPPRGAAIAVSAVVVLFAVVNLWWVPALVTRRVCAHLARELRGSVLEGDDDWVVP